MRILIIIILLTFPTSRVAETKTSATSGIAEVKKGTQAYKNQQWDEAIDHYMNALEDTKNADIVQYDLGTAFYKKGNYGQSIEHLKKASTTKNKTLAPRMYYNLGNALYKKGRSLENSNIDGAIDSLQKSLANYATDINLTPKDQDVVYNQDFVKKELERLKKKKQQKESQQQQGQQGQGKENKQGQGQQSQSKQSQAQQSQTKAQNQQEQNGLKQQQQQQQNFEKQEAKQLLDDYENEEAPKGLLNFANRDHGEEKHVDKDW